MCSHLISDFHYRDRVQRTGASFLFALFFLSRMRSKALQSVCILREDKKVDVLYFKKFSFISTCRNVRKTIQLMQFYFLKPNANSIFLIVTTGCHRPELEGRPCTV